jgi:glycosyltransferase involved in cell wall biosynthesis
MPVYNEGSYIGEALDSLLAQTFTDFELIIADNASTDNTRETCLAYAARHPRIQYIRHSDNHGSMANFQFVLDVARGEFFMWAAADDLWDSTWLGAMMELLTPGTALAFSSVLRFKDDIQKGTRVTLRSLTGPPDLRMIRYFLWSEFSGKACAIYGLYRTDVVRTVAAEIFGPKVDFQTFALDNLFVLKVVHFGSLSIDPNVTFYKRDKPPRIHLSLGAKFRNFRNFASLQIWPYLFDCVHRFPPGPARYAALCSTPLKYVWLAGRGLGPVVRHLLPRRRRLSAPLPQNPGQRVDL